MTEKRPNILLITTDQQHWDTIGRFHDLIETPSLDRLIDRGVHFSRAYCSNPTCTPSRASILTGKYPSQHGAWSLGTKLPGSENTLAQILRDNSYRTALIGKAHFEPLKSTGEYPSSESLEKIHDLEFWKTFHGPYYGFEHVELQRGHGDTHEVGEHYALWLEEKGLSNWKDYFQEPFGSRKRQKMIQEEFSWDLPEEYHHTAFVAERTKAKLEEYRDGNDTFFLWASFLDPHYPQVVPEPWGTMYDPGKITLPDTLNQNHKDSPPLVQMTQNRNMILRKQMEDAYAGDDNEEQAEKIDFEAMVRKFEKIPGVYKVAPMLKYYQDFLEQGETPYLLHGVHPHFYGEEELRRQIAVYYGKITMIDRYIGAILDRLEELRLIDDTVIIFTSDHGDYFGQHGLVHKGPFHYEDGIRIPWIVSFPKKMKKTGYSSPALQSVVDIAPTVLSLCGVPAPRDMAGVDQSEVWLGHKKKARDHAICEMRHSPIAVHLKTYVNERYKITVYCDEPRGELYDLEKDPGETRNLWNDPKQSDLKSRLLLEFIWGEMKKEPMIMPRIADA